MNIALLLDRIGNGNGTARMALSVARECARRGHEIHLYSSVLSRDAARTHSGDGVHVHWLPSLRGALRLLSQPLGQRLLSLQDKHDVVVGNGLNLTQDVIVMHNDPQPVELRKLAATPCGTWAPNLKGWKRSVRTALEARRFAAGRFSRVVSLSRASAREIQQTFDVPDGRIRVIPHGVDAEHFAPERALAQRACARRRWGFRDADVVFLYIGDAWKGLEFAIRALGRLGARARLLAVGPFPAAPFASLAQSLGVPFDWARSEPDPRQFYSASDAFLLPTPLDTFGLCVFEALATGLPAVVSRRAGVAELLDHGQNAQLVAEPWDLDELARACQALLEPDVRRRIGENGRRLTLAYPWSRAAENHLEVYREAATERRQGPI